MDKSLTHATFFFTEPDFSTPAEQRAYFSYPPSRKVVKEVLPLYDLRTSSDVIPGAKGLDVQGFTYISHFSSCDEEKLLQGNNVEDVYVPAITELLQDLTGASRVVCYHVGFRHNLPEKNDGHSGLRTRNAERDRAIAEVSRRIPVVSGSSGMGLPPASLPHVDINLEGLRKVIRFSNAVIREAAAKQIEAEDLRIVGADVVVPRFATYNIWRPLKTVMRDPLAVLDCRTLQARDVIAAEMRFPGELAPDCSFIAETLVGLPPKDPTSQKWFWLPKQEPHELLIMKLADSAAETDPEMASTCLHVSPQIEGTEEEEPRFSIEARLHCFWD